MIKINKLLNIEKIVIALDKLFLTEFGFLLFLVISTIKIYTCSRHRFPTVIEFVIYST